MRQMKRVKRMVRGEIDIADGIRVDATSTGKKGKGEKRLSTVAQANTRRSQAPRRTGPPQEAPTTSASYAPPAPTNQASFPPPPDWEDHSPSEDYEDEASEEEPAPAAFPPPADWEQQGETDDSDQG